MREALLHNTIDVVMVQTSKVNAMLGEGELTINLDSLGESALLYPATLVVELSVEELWKWCELEKSV